MPPRAAASGVDPHGHPASFRANPRRPCYAERTPTAAEQGAPGVANYRSFEGGIVEIGHDGANFSFDCERPRHRELIEPFKLADRPVTNGEWIEFIADGGYRNPLLWLSDGWAQACKENWSERNESLKSEYAMRLARYLSLHVVDAPPFRSSWGLYQRSFASPSGLDPSTCGKVHPASTPEGADHENTAPVNFCVLLGQPPRFQSSRNLLKPRITRPSRYASSCSKMPVALMTFTHASSDNG